MERCTQPQPVAFDRWGRALPARLVVLILVDFVQRGRDVFLAMSVCRSWRSLPVSVLDAAFRRRCLAEFAAWTWDPLSYDVGGWQCAYRDRCVTELNWAKGMPTSVNLLRLTDDWHTWRGCSRGLTGSRCGRVVVLQCDVALVVVQRDEDKGTICHREIPTGDLMDQYLAAVPSQTELFSVTFSASANLVCIRAACLSSPETRFNELIGKFDLSKRSTANDGSPIKAKIAVSDDGNTLAVVWSGDGQTSIVCWQRRQLEAPTGSGRTDWQSLGVCTAKGAVEHIQELFSANQLIVGCGTRVYRCSVSPTCRVIGTVAQDHPWATWSAPLANGRAAQSYDPFILPPIFAGSEHPKGYPTTARHLRIVAWDRESVNVVADLPPPPRTKRETRSYMTTDGDRRIVILRETRKKRASAVLYFWIPPYSEPVMLPLSTLYSSVVERQWLLRSKCVHVQLNAFGMTLLLCDAGGRESLLFVRFNPVPPTS